MQLETVFSGCSNGSCPNTSILDESSLTDSKYRLNVFYSSPSDTIQSLLDNMFNQFNENTSYLCQLSDNKEGGGGSLGLHGCRGTRLSKPSISSRPIILEIATSEGTSGKRVTCGNEMEMYITVLGVRYQLVGALLNDGHHWRSLNPVHGKFLRYDGILHGSSENYMRWLRPSENFGKNYRAVSYWYMSRDHITPSLSVKGEFCFSWSQSVFEKLTRPQM